MLNLTCNSTLEDMGSTFSLAIPVSTPRRLCFCHYEAGSDAGSDDGLDVT